MASESSLDAPPRAWVEVDLAALVRNARALERHARAPLIAMVKADAYGLGAVPVVRALESLKPLAYGVSSIAEGAELRGAGIGRPIILFTPSRAEELDAVLRARLTPTLASPEGIARWAALAGGDWQLAIDTGMHRAGIAWDAVASLADALRRSPPLGAFTHFHSAELDDGSMQGQEERFRAAVAELPLRPQYLHADNSAAIVRRHPSAWDCVRPGVFLYGVGSGATAALQPEPVVHLRARVQELRDVADGESVSYDATWRAVGTRCIATVAVGYGDGYRRSLGNRGRVIAGHGLVPVAGVVTMDMTMLDVTDSPVAVGDVVTMLGRAGDRLLTVESVAELAQLSPYELLTGLRQRLPRVYVGGP